METLTANGVDLSTLAYNVEDLAGLLRTPVRRGEDVPVPGRNGLLRVPHKLHDAGEFVLPMWVIGCDTMGGVPSGSTQEIEFYRRVDELTRLFHTDTVTLDHTLPDGTVRRAVCEVADTMEPERRLGSPLFGRLAVALTNPGAFWTEVTPTSVTFSLTTGQHRVISEFAAATAPMDELVITFEAGSNPEISQPSSGTYLAYDGIIAAGRKLVVDTSDWTLDPGDGTAWTPLYSALRHGGAPGRWFTLFPETGGPDVIVTHTGGGSMSCTVSGRRKYLSG